MRDFIDEQPPFELAKSLRGRMLSSIAILAKLMKKKL